MINALRYLSWPLLAGLLLALLIIQRYPHWVGLDTEPAYTLQQAPLAAGPRQGPYSYAGAVSSAAPAVANLYTTKIIDKPQQTLPKDDPLFQRFFGDNLPR